MQSQKTREGSCNMLLGFYKGLKNVMLWLTWLEKSTTRPFVMETKVSALQVKTGWLDTVEKAKVGVRVILQTFYPLSWSCSFVTRQTDDQKMKKGIRFEWLYNTVNCRCVKVLGVSQIIRENPEIINKTDSQSRNPAPDLKQLSKKKTVAWKWQKNALKFGK